MDATSILCSVAEALHHANLEAVMIDNAAAAIQGAPVTTMDIDFCIEDNENNIKKLSKVANELEAELTDFYPFFQIQNPDNELYLDFLTRVIGIDSFESLLAKSTTLSFDGIFSLNIASLEDIIKSKTVAGNDKDLAVLPILEKTLKLRNEKK
jgi:hypothetical protein